MNGRDALRDRGRSLEEEWAERRAREAIVQLRRRMDEEEQRRRLAEHTGIRSGELLQRIRAHGFDAESVELLFLVPLVGMASADGTVSYDERALVKELARQGGVRPGTPAWAILDGWLLDPPADATIEDMLTLLEEVLRALPPGQADVLRRRIRGAVDRVGRASGGVWGIGALSRAERQFAAKVTSRV